MPREGGVTTHRWWALAVVSAASLTLAIDVSIINIALPEAQAALRIPDGDRHWAVTAYALAFGALLLLGGRIADFLGRKRIFLLGLLGFGAASALGGLAVGPGMLFAARAMQGLFAALLAPAGLSLVALTFTGPRERATAFGVYSAVQGVGGTAGLILGGLLTQYGSWRWCLLINVPVVVVVAVAALPVIREGTARTHRHYDVGGALLGTCGLVALVYGCGRAGNEGWVAAPTVVPLGIALVLLTAFVMVERRLAHPLLPLRVVLDRERGAAFLVLGLVGAAMFGTFLLLTYHFQVGLGYGPVEAGLAFLPFSVGILLGAPIASTLLPRIGPRFLLGAGLGLATCALLLLSRADPTNGPVLVFGGEVAMSLGLGVAFVPLGGLALARIRDGDTGVASAVVNMSQQIGGALGVALLNGLFTAALVSFATPDGAAAGASSLIAGYRTAFPVAAGMLAVATLVAIVMVRGAVIDTGTPGPDVATERGVT